MAKLFLDDKFANWWDLNWNDTINARNQGKVDHHIEVNRGDDTVYAGEGDDDIYDNGWDDEGRIDTGYDRLFGDAGNDTFHIIQTGNLIDGGDDIDTVSFAAFNRDLLVGTADGSELPGVNVDIADETQYRNIENVVGSDFDDVIKGNALDNKLQGGKGDDEIYGGKGADTLEGGRGDDILNGGLGHDLLKGGKDDDELYGGLNSDVLEGGSGDDDLFGGAHADILTGGSGIDVFGYTLASDSRTGAADVITDFEKGTDKIDLSAIDANGVLRGNGQFRFIEEDEFNELGGQVGPGELRAYYDAETNQTIIQGNTDLDGEAEIEIRLEGQVDVTADDFVL